jgi:Holliday junction resolvasome RuvABC endonuclease subunit
MEELRYAGIDVGVYTTTIAFLDARSELIAVEKLYKSTSDEPRIARAVRHPGERHTDPIAEQIAKDHRVFMHSVIDKYKPTAFAVESMVWSAGRGNTNIESLTAHFRGIMHCVTIDHDTPFYLVAPSQIKKVVTGNGNADKREVCRHVWNKYDVKLQALGVRNYTALFKYNHYADAIGAAMYLTAQELNYIDESVEDTILNWGQE